MQRTGSLSISTEPTKKHTVLIATPEYAGVYLCGGLGVHLRLLCMHLAHTGLWDVHVALPLYEHEKRSSPAPAQHTNELPGVENHDGVWIHFIRRPLIFKNLYPSFSTDYAQHMTTWCFTYADAVLALASVLKPSLVITNDAWTAHVPALIRASLPNTPSLHIIHNANLGYDGRFQWEYRYHNQSHHHFGQNAGRSALDSPQWISALDTTHHRHLVASALRTSTAWATVSPSYLAALQSFDHLQPILSSVPAGVAILPGVAVQRLRSLYPEPHKIVRDKMLRKYLPRAFSDSLVQRRRAQSNQSPRLLHQHNPRFSNTTSHRSLSDSTSTSDSEFDSQTDSTLGEQRFYESDSPPFTHGISPGSTHLLSTRFGHSPQRSRYSQEIKPSANTRDSSIPASSRRLSSEYGDDVFDGFSEIEDIHPDEFNQEDIEAEIAEQEKSCLVSQDFDEKISSTQSNTRGEQLSSSSSVSNPQVPTSEHKRHERDFMTVVYVGRLTEDKGVGLLLAAFPDWIKSFKGRVGLIVCGNRASGDILASARTCLEAGPNRFAIIHADGFFGDGALLQAGADFGILPSFLEPGGITQHEFFAFGTPVIAHAAGGLKDTVQPARNGILYATPPEPVPYNSEEHTRRWVSRITAATAAALRMWEDPERSHRLRYSTAKTPRHANHAFSEWERLIASLVSS